jgi:hypothetical protein
MISMVTCLGTQNTKEWILSSLMLTLKTSEDVSMCKHVYFYRIVWQADYVDYRLTWYAEFSEEYISHWPRFLHTETFEYHVKKSFYYYYSSLFYRILLISIQHQWVNSTLNYLRKHLSYNPPIPYSCTLYKYSIVTLKKSKEVLVLNSWHYQAYSCAPSSVWSHVSLSTGHWL